MVEYASTLKLTSKGGKMESAVNSLFPEILPGKANFDIFDETLEIYKLREEVLTRLTFIENNDDGSFWWQDKDLIGIFNTLYTSGIILLPRDPVDRLRWIALLCVEISNYEEFDCGNIILPVDFLPAEIFELYEEVYPENIVEGVKKIRKQLAEQGWESMTF